MEAARIPATEPILDSEDDRWAGVTDPGPQEWADEHEPIPLGALLDSEPDPLDSEWEVIPDGDVEVIEAAASPSPAWTNSRTMSWTHLPDTEPDPTETHAERVARFRAAMLEREEGTPALSETAERLDEALARDQKFDLRLGQGERELWDRAAQTVGVTTSEFARDAVNRAAEETLAYVTTE